MQSLRKIKRVEPIIKMKQTKVDEEAMILGQVRKQKLEVIQAMKDSQRRYMSGVEELNRIRSSPLRAQQDAVESGLDHVKAQWYKLYKQVQDIEAKEREQIGRVLTAERDLKAVENLRERYQLEYRKETSRSEQKQLDELALRQFSQR